MAMEIASTAMEIISRSITDRLLSIWEVEKNVKDLVDNAKELRTKLDEVQTEIKREGGALWRTASNRLETWIKCAKKLLEEADVIIEKHGSGCVILGVPFNCISAQTTSWRSMTMCYAIKEALDFIRYLTEEVERNFPPPEIPRSKFTTPGGEIESKLKTALEFLRNDEQGILNVCGMGGVGKTTLLQQIEQEITKDPSSFGFHCRLFVTASRGCSIERIQNLMADQLGLQESGSADHHNLTNAIFEYLRDKSFVILLDDLWDCLDLKEAGIPFPLGVVEDEEAGISKKRKLIFTTRPPEQVHPDIQTDQTVKIECLSQEAARILFRERVGLEAIINNSDPLISKLVDQVADECDGLPQAIINLGQAMAGNRDVKVWQKLVEDLHPSTPTAAAPPSRMEITVEEE